MLTRWMKSVICKHPMSTHKRQVINIEIATNRPKTKYKIKNKENFYDYFTTSLD